MLSLGFTSIPDRSWQCDDCVRRSVFVTVLYLLVSICALSVNSVIWTRTLSSALILIVDVIFTKEKHAAATTHKPC